MIDRTSVGISPLLSAPMESYVTTPGLTTDVFAQPASLATGTFAQPFSVATDPYAQPIPLTPILDQGLALPPTTTSILPDATGTLMAPSLLPDAGLGASFVPATTLPDPSLSFIPDVTGVSPLVQSPDLLTQAAVPSVVAPSVVAPTLPSVVPSVATPSVVAPALPSVVPSVATPSVVAPTLPPVAASVVPPTSSLSVPGVGLPVAGVEGSALPSLASPELVSPNPLAQATGSYATSSAGGMVPPPVPQNQPVGPIMDEDFQRGRPIYDELAEDRYRGFRFGR